MKRLKMSRIITFRVTEKDWLEIERAAAESDETPNEWCRTTTLETARMPIALTPTQRIMFAQMARIFMRRSKLRCQGHNCGRIFDLRQRRDSQG